MVHSSESPEEHIFLKTTVEFTEPDLQVHLLVASVIGVPAVVIPSSIKASIFIKAKVHCYIMYNFFCLRDIKWKKGG